MERLSRDEEPASDAEESSPDADPAARTAITRTRRRQPKVSELIARDLVDQIIEDDLPSGTRLPTEREMAASMGIGRTTLREALRLLETRGVITIRSGPAGGPIVSRPRPSDLSEALTLFLQFQGSTLMDVRLARQAIEPMLARLVAHDPSPETLAALEACVNETREHLDREDAFLPDVSRFHHILAAASGSAVLNVFYQTLTATVSAAATTTAYSEDRRLHTIKAHETILEAVRARDEMAAFHAMLDHLKETDHEWMHLNSVALARPVRWLL